MNPLRLLALGALFATQVQAAELRVLPPGQLPHDTRLAPPKELDGYFPFTPAASPEEWAPRRARVERQLKVALGLWPAPGFNYNGNIYGRLDRGDYTVEMVTLEVMPGFFVTGNLYRPKEEPGKRYPGVLCPYGHWPNGRFMDVNAKDREKQFALGAETIGNAAHSPLQARCVQLARMGCVVFHYDMIGRGDSNQIPGEIAHSFAKQRPEMNAPQGWGLFSPRAEGNFESIMGLQTWSSICALQFLSQQGDVDPSRMAVTGASGGGTQSMILAALERDKLRAAFPAVMVSTAMQGGCTCENASGVRVGTGNVEFAAMFAPKPMGMTAADDWTKHMPEKGFPELQKHWAMMGAPAAVSLAAHPEFPHNYNAVSRAAMYEWFNKYLNLNLPRERLVERDFQLLPRSQMSVWDAEHQPPPGGEEFEKGLMKWWYDDAQKQLLHTMRDFREQAPPALEIVAGRSWAEVGPVETELKDKADRGDYMRMTGLIKNTAHGEELPAIDFHPKKWNGATVLWLTDEGKAGLLQGDEPRPEVLALLKAGVSVLGVDLLDQGEFLPPGEKFTKTPVSKNPREAACFTYGYNQAVLAQRADDILTVRKMVATNEHHHTRVFGLIAQGQTGAAAALARSIIPELCDAAAIETNGFRFLQVKDLRDPMFLPGGVKYGDLPGMLALGAPKPLLLIGEPNVPTLTAAMYEAEGATPAVETQPVADVAAAATWLQDKLK
jgi:hypothetical protein